jgi:hypothetical protein
LPDIEQLREMHMGRSWTGNVLEKDCPCPKAACGLVAGWSEDCDQHRPSASRTMRQVHTLARCPAYVPF